MKKNLFLFAIIFLLHTEVSNAGIFNTPVPANPGYTITVKTQDLQNTYLFLSRRASGNWINLDSALVSPAATAEFKGTLESPEMLYLRLENSGKEIPFFAENSNIVILPDFGKAENTRVSGSSVHDEYTSYLSSLADLNAEKDQAYKLYMEANKSGDETKKKEAVEKFGELSSIEMERNKGFIMANSGSWVSPFIIRSSMSYALSLDELKTLVSILDEKLNASVYVKQLKDHIAILEKVAIGMAFTDFQLPTPEGKELSLSDIAGKNYLLIDFWASWCGPCRRENPNVVALYNDFKENGFEILGVSFDTNRENWLKAIEDDKLSWHHVSDLNGWGNAAGKLYGINSIPHTVLLDPNGVIIEKNLTTDELREKLNKFLKD